MEEIIASNASVLKTDPLIKDKHKYRTVAYSITNEVYKKLEHFLSE